MSRTHLLEQECGHCDHCWLTANSPSTATSSGAHRAFKKSTRACRRRLTLTRLFFRASIKVHWITQLLSLAGVITLMMMALTLALDVIMLRLIWCHKFTTRKLWWHAISSMSNCCYILLSGFGHKNFFMPLSRDSFPLNIVVLPLFDITYNVIC